MAKVNITVNLKPRFNIYVVYILSKLGVKPKYLFKVTTEV